MIINHEQIFLLYNKYQTDNNKSLPEIDEILFDSTDDISYFNIIDLYNKTYILHVSLDFLDNEYIDEWVRGVFYHEFTHLSDAVDNKNDTYKRFRDILMIYSEVNAASVQLKESLQGDPPVVVDEHETVSLSNYITSYLKATKNMLVKTKESNNIIDFNPYILLYYLGQLRCLNNLGAILNYKLLLEALPSSIAFMCEPLIDNVLGSYIDVDMLIEDFAVLKLFLLTKPVI